MTIKPTIEVVINHGDLADEFCKRDSEYQASAINSIARQFRGWTRDPNKTATYVQMLEIAGQLNDDGKWFIRTICEYAEGDKNG
jgi:hypothetical protein